ncbi:C-type lectin 37Db [Drosophila willistoni]|uniref:C-type lectin 37Db n=1 Tax=Drosophila willistoni TaxID=7260 RepID=UPI000C26D9A9|nr:C-type lectin 37Db [Drosophila willistoni]
MSTKFYVILLLVSCQNAWGSIPNSLELRPQCDAFCFDALKPILDHIAANQNRWNTCDSTKLADIQGRLDKLETQLKEQQEKIATKEGANTETDQKCSAATEKSTKEIPKNFAKLGSKYYYIERFHLLNWFAALHTCRQMGGHLASPQNQEELNELRKALPTNRAYWIDINDLSSEGEYMSETSGMRAPFLQWSPGEPNNYESKEHCVELRMLKNDQSMNDNVCVFKLYFICEIDVDL